MAVYLQMAVIVSCRPKSEPSQAASLLATADEAGGITIWQAHSSNDYKVGDEDSNKREET